MPLVKVPKLRILDGGDEKGRISAGTSDADADNDLPFEDSGVGAVPENATESGVIASGVERSSRNVMMGQDPGSMANVVAGQFTTGEMPKMGREPEDDELSPFEVEGPTSLNLGGVLKQLEDEGVITRTNPEEEKKASVITNVARTFVLACKKHAADEPGKIGAVILELLESALVDIQSLLVQKQLMLRRELLIAPQNEKARESFMKDLEPKIIGFKNDLQNEVRTILEESQRYLPHEVKTDFAHYSLIIFEALFKGTQPGQIVKPQKNATLELSAVLGSAYTSLTQYCASIPQELVIADSQNLDAQDLLISREVIPTPNELFERTLTSERITIEEVEAITREIESVPYYTVAEINAVFGELDTRTATMWNNESLRRSLLSAVQEYVMAGVLGQKEHQAKLRTTVAELLAELEDDVAELEMSIRQHPSESSVSIRRGNLSPEPTAATGDDDDAQPRALTPEELEAIEADVDLKFDLLDGDEAEPNATGTPAAKDAVEIVEEGPSSGDVDFDEDAIVSALDELESKPGDDKQPEAVVVAKISIGSSTYRTFVEKILSRRDLVAQVLANHPEPIDQITVLTGGIRLIMRPINIHVEEGRMEPSARDGLYQSVAQLLEQSGVQPYIVQFCLWAYENVIDDESIRAAYTEAVSVSGEQTANAEQVQPTNHEETPTPDLVETTFNSLREQYTDVEADFVNTLVVCVRNALSAGRSGQDKRSRLNNAYEEFAADIQAIKNSTSPDSAKNLLHQGLSSLGFTEIAIDIMFEYSGRVTQFHSYLTDTIAGDVFVATFTDDAEEVEDPVIPEELPSTIIDPSLKKAQLDGKIPFPSMQKFGQHNKE